MWTLSIYVFINHCDYMVQMNYGMSGLYRIAGNFRGVQIFAFFEDAHLSVKLKSCNACMQTLNSNEMDAKLAS